MQDVITIRQLLDCQTGQKVCLPSSTKYDYSYLRSGVVVREGGRSGIFWDGPSTRYFEYPDDWEFALLGEAEIGAIDEDRQEVE